MFIHAEKDPLSDPAGHVHLEKPLDWPPPVSLEWLEQSRYALKRIKVVMESHRVTIETAAQFTAEPGALPPLTLPTAGPAEGKSEGLFPDPLQPIRDKLQLGESELTNQTDRVARRQQLDERLASRFKEVVSFACSSLARDDRSRKNAFFPDLARSLLAFNEALREADREYPLYRILDRLCRAAHASVPALDTAASLLLLEPATDFNRLVTDLKRIQESRPHDVWSMWLTYILDQLLNSHRPPTKDCVPPDTTRGEWRQAEFAFGCILFSDESFRILQESMDHAACLIDDALKCGGHHVLNRPPGRVRDLIARFDPRALQWYGSELPPVPLLQPPPSIETIVEPVALRRQLDEVWTAANCLQMALDKWAAWFVELREKGDAHPAIALNCSDMAHRAVKVLLTHRLNVEPFDNADKAGLLAMLPPMPAWWMPGTDVEIDAEGSELMEKPRVRWQEDREFLDAYYWPPEQRQRKVNALRGAAVQLIDLLKSFPMTAIASARAVRSSGEVADALASGKLPAERSQTEKGMDAAIETDRRLRADPLWATLDACIIHLQEETQTVLFEKALDFQHGLNIVEINRLALVAGLAEGSRRVFAEEEVREGGVLDQRWLKIFHPEIEDCVRWQVWGRGGCSRAINPDKLRRTIAYVRAWQNQRRDQLQSDTTSSEEGQTERERYQGPPRSGATSSATGMFGELAELRGECRTRRLALDVWNHTRHGNQNFPEDCIRELWQMVRRIAYGHDKSPPQEPDEVPDVPAALRGIDVVVRWCEEQESATSGPDYPHQFPLVAERDSRRARQAATGRTLDFRQTEMVQLGFPWDWWLPLELARQWRSHSYPTDRSRNAVQQWQVYMEECVSCANISGIMRTVASKLQEDAANDLALLEQAVESHAAIVPHLSCGENAPGQETQVRRRAVEPALNMARLSQAQRRAVAGLADLFYDSNFLPVSLASYTWQDAAAEHGLKDYWSEGISKRPAIVRLLESTLQHQPDSFCGLILTVVHRGIKRRQKNTAGSYPPITQEAIATLKGLLLAAGFEIPTELNTLALPDSLPPTREDTQPPDLVSVMPADQPLENISPGSPQSGDESRKVKFGWLHLTDLHFGMSGQKWLWPNIREEFFRDLEKLHRKAGPWDLVLFTGDFVQKGGVDEFRKLDELLGELWGHLRQLGSTPILLGVPGNHDLVRPDSAKAAVVALRTNWTDAQIQQKFWEKPSSEYRKVIQKAFKNYVSWWEARTLPRLESYRAGLLPGDFSATLEKHGVKLGLVGLNTTFLQLGGGNYEGKLAFSPKQFHQGCGGDGVAWTREHQTCLLLTHQPPHWLTPDSQADLHGEIAVPGRFAAHLFGHMHESATRTTAHGGADARREWQGCSLFGLEEWGEGGGKKQRLHGYSAGCIEVEGGQGSIRIWPRKAEQHQAGHQHIVPDHSFTLEEDGGTRPEPISVVTRPIT